MKDEPQGILQQIDDLELKVEDIRRAGHDVEGFTITRQLTKLKHKAFQLGIYPPIKDGMDVEKCSFLKSLLAVARPKRWAA